MDFEMFRIIKGFENYSVSNLGRVKNNVTGKIRSPCIRGNYKRLQLQQDNRKSNFVIHRLVAFAFIDRVKDKNIIDHIDGNCLNNDVLNLRWCSHTENGRNTKLSVVNKSGHKGVCFDTSKNKYKAYIQIDDKLIHLGYFVN